jgi:hypothetical protein
LLRAVHFLHDVRESRLFTFPRTPVSPCTRSHSLVYKAE